jgi:hypothetical protein
MSGELLTPGEVLSRFSLRLSSDGVSDRVALPSVVVRPPSPRAPSLPRQDEVQPVVVSSG